MANTEGAATGTRRTAKSRTSDLTSRVGERVTESYEQARECVTDYPAAAVLTVFAVGFGVGMALGCALSGPSQSSMSWYDRRHAEKFGRSILDSIAGMMPDAVASRLHS